MTVALFAALVAVGAFCAGLLGALTGLGGGIVIVPMLTVVFHVDLRYAIGASLISVIATSSGAAASFLRSGFTNLRVGAFLDVATTSGAVIGAVLSPFIPTRALALLLGLVLLYTAISALRTRIARPMALAPHPLATRLRLDGEYPSPDGPQQYAVQGVPRAFGLMLVAGLLSALLGIGSGVIKVLAMDGAMRLPFKVSTTTSTFMIGVTAAASAGVYLRRGYIDPTIALPVMLGVLAGALAGARILTTANTRWLRHLFTAVVVVLAVQMLYRAVRGTP